MSLNHQAINLIKKYQKNKIDGYSGRCKHYPSCSHYGIECYEKFNFFKATFLTVKRILSCNYFTKKYYDPVPLSKQEKKSRKIAMDNIKDFQAILLTHYQKYPLMQTQDFIKLIYQNSFGPHHFSNDLTIDDVTKYIKDELTKKQGEETLVDIGNGYMRVHLGIIDSASSLDKLVKVFLKSMRDDNEKSGYSDFLLKIDLFKELIKSRKIKLNKRKAYKEIDDYLMKGIKPVHHSNIYNTAYEPHYRLVKKQYWEDYKK